MTRRSANYVNIRNYLEILEVIGYVRQGKYSTRKGNLYNGEN